MRSSGPFHLCLGCSFCPGTLTARRLCSGLPRLLGSPPPRHLPCELRSHLPKRPKRHGSGYGNHSPAAHTVEECAGNRKGKGIVTTCHFCEKTEEKERTWGRTCSHRREAPRKAVPERTLGCWEGPAPCVDGPSGAFWVGTLRLKYRFQLK